MPPKACSETESAVMVLVGQGYFYRKIIQALSNQNIAISRRAIANIIERSYNKDFRKNQSQKKSKDRGKPRKRSSGLIGKVKTALAVENPPTQRDLAKKFGISQSTIKRIIHQDLSCKVRKKHSVHKLSSKQAEQRLARGPSFLKYINGSKWRNILTLDEGWVYLSDTGKQRRIYYEFRGVRSDYAWRKYCKEAHPEGVMFVAGVSSRGVTKLRFVEPGAKINSQYYQENVLKPIIEEDIPRLFGKKGKKRVVLHHDNAPSHRSRSTQNWLRNSGIKFIPEDEWMSNSPDLAPMDYCVNGIFKWNLFKRRPTTVQGLKQVMTSVWNSLSQSVINKALSSWQDRVNLMIRCDGYQIEHLLNKK